jgi:thioredoxin reductase
MHEVVVIGGGPAGLQAALTVARVHRDVVLLDAGEGRNAPASHMHNLVTRDGVAPEEFRRVAREEVASYPTAQVRRARVRRVSAVPAMNPEGDGGSEGACGSEDAGARDGADTSYLVELEGGELLTTRTLILATGVVDELPDVPGLAELWGDLVVQCPFCHGHEMAGRRVGILGAGAAEHVGGIMARVAEEVVVLTDGEELDARLHLPVVTDPVGSVERCGEGLRVLLRSGESLELAGLFVASTTRQAAPFARQLGLECNDSACVRVDEHARTSLPRVYAAGDMAHLASLPAPVQSVAQAIASGAIAGGSAVADAVDAGRPLRIGGGQGGRRGG